MPLTNSVDGTYQLNLKQQKSNVFVTQLNEQDHEDDDIRRFPVVKETSDELLRTGINTLQKTSLLRKAVEVKLVDEELAAKREEFRKRMEINKSKEELLKNKQEKIKERVNKFDKFLKENEAKRHRALQKYQKEVRANKLRSEELAQMKLEVEQLEETKRNVLKKLEHYKKFADFMAKVVDNLPDNYIEMREDNMTESFIQRHEGLAVTHEDLIQRNKERSEIMERGQRELELMRQERGKQRLLINQELAELQKYQEELAGRTRRLEQQISDNTKAHRSDASELGRITMAIDNIAILCHNRYWPNLTNMSYVGKLSMIDQHLQYREQVRNFAQDLLDEEEYSSSKFPLKSSSELPEMIKLPSIVTFADTKPSKARRSDVKKPHMG